MYINMFIERKEVSGQTRRSSHVPIIYLFITFEDHPRGRKEKNNDNEIIGNNTTIVYACHRDSTI